MTGWDAPADSERLRAALPDRWQRVQVVAETGSTNADLAERARAGEPGDQVLAAYHQTAGRGRLDRTWTAPPGSSVAVSLLVHPPDATPGWSWLPLLTGHAVRAAVRDVTGLAPELKWPNDVLVGGRKLAGILAEMVPTPAGRACVVGCGLNVTMTEEQRPVPTATSLNLERPDAPPVDPVALLTAVVRAWAAAYDDWVGDRVMSLRHDYLAHCGTVGQEVVVTRRGSVPVHGLALGVDTDGRLLVRTPGGVQPVAAGDVHHVR